jgi:hypothetical protein
MMELNNGGFLSGFTVHVMAHEKIFSRVHDPSIFSAVSTIKQTHHAFPELQTSQLKRNQMAPAVRAFQ